MSKYDFGEKTHEWSNKQGCDIPVWQSPKYKESKAKAVEILDSGKYGVKPSDFWILMNETKSGKMAYTGLIISHNGCLKINDALESKFDPYSVSLDKDGFNNSLVYSYCNGEQGIYEVGEVSKSNCKNDYPYAMAFKRLFDRVVLKLSKLAYAGIYSDSEAEEFKDPQNERTEAVPDANGNETIPACEGCGGVISPIRKRDGEIWGVTDIVVYSKKRFNRQLCPDCQKAALKTEG